MRKLLFILLVQTLFFTEILVANENYIYPRKVDGHELSIVTNIPISQIKPLDAFHFEVFPDESGNYFYRVNGKIDGVEQVVSYIVTTNTFDFNIPSSFETIELTIEARPVFGDTWIEKTIVINFSAPIVLSKSEVYQHEDLIITHPLIKSGQTYSVVFNNGLEFSQSVSIMAIIDRELTVKIPSYQGSEKLSVSIQEMKNRDRKMISVLTGAGISGNKNEIKPSELLLLTILEDVELSLDSYPATLNGQEIVLYKNAENTLVWTADTIPEGNYQISFVINGLQFNYSFRMLAATEIQNPTQYVDDYFQNISNKISEINDNPDISVPIKAKLVELLNNSSTNRQDLSVEELKVLASFLDSNNFNFSKMYYKGNKAKINIFAELLIKENQQLLVSLTVPILTHLAISTAATFVPACNTPTTIALCRTIVSLSLVANMTFLVLELADSGGRLVDLILKYSDTLLGSKGLTFKDRVPLDVSPISVYENLNMNDKNSTEPVVRILYETLAYIRAKLDAFTDKTGIEFDFVDISKIPRKTHNLPTDPSYFKDLANVLPVKVKKYLLDKNGTKLTLAFQSMASGVIPFNFDLSYSYPGIVSNKKTNISATIETIEKCQSETDPGEKGTMNRNPDKTVGGFVSDEAKVSKDVFVNKDSAICGKSKISGKETFISGQLKDAIIKGDNLSIGGQVDNSSVIGNFIRVGSTMKNSQISGSYININDNLSILTNTTIRHQPSKADAFMQVFRTPFKDTNIDTFGEDEYPTFGFPVFFKDSNFNGASVSGTKITLIESLITSSISGDHFYIFQSTINSSLSGSFIRMEGNVIVPWRKKINEDKKILVKLPKCDFKNLFNKYFTESDCRLST